MRIVIAGDSAGKPLIDVIETHLAKRPGVTLVNLSPGAAHSPAQIGEFYASTAERAAVGIIEGHYDRGILCCGTGIGVAMSANKVPGIRAAQTHDPYSAERAAKSNNAQIITLGARVIGPELAKTIVDAFLASEFDPAGPSAGNVAAVNALDVKYSSKT